MQLVDEGTLTLDTPVAEIIPDFAVVDADVARTVTVRHLLTHTSGIDGDVFTDTGRGDDCVELYVEKMREVGQNHPLGATFSYCNSGFVLAGRIVEVLTGKTWDVALRERIIDPLGLTATVTLPEEALLHRAAVGHVGEPGEEPTPAPVWVLPRSAGPAGLITARVHDLLVFAAAHLAGGVAPNGTRILSAESTDAMTQWQVDLPDPTTAGRLLGAGLDPVRLGRTPAGRARRRHHRPGRVPAGAARCRLRRRAADQRWRRPRAVPGTVHRDLRRAGRCRHADRRRAAGAPGRGRRPVAATSGGTRAPGWTPRSISEDGELRLRATTTGPLAALQTKPEEYRLGAGRQRRLAS